MKINDSYKKIILFLFITFILVTPFIYLQAQAPLVNSSCGQISGGKLNKECDFQDFLDLVNRILNWIIIISVPVATGVIAWAGFLYMTTGIAETKNKAKEILKKVFWGLIFILAAWIIVKTIISALLNSTFSGNINI